MRQKPIKVVHYSTTFLSLTQNWIYYQISNLDKVDVSFYSYYRQNKEIFPFENLRWVKETEYNIPSFINKIWNKHAHWSPHYLYWLLKDNPDIIHAHFGTSGYHMLPYSKLLRIPLITSFYGHDAYRVPKIDPRWRKKYKRLFRHGQLFIAEGPVMRKKLIELGCPKEKVIIHHIGVIPETYEFGIRIPEGKIRLMIAGRFVEKKGIPYAIEALSKIKSKINKKVTLTVVGDSNKKGALTKEKRKILNTVKSFGVSKVVKFTGFVNPSEVAKIALKHHIFLCPSIHATDGDAEGGFPVTLTEMLAIGMPVVAFDHCDIPHIIKDGKSGFLALERDIDAFVDKLKCLIEYPELWVKMGKFGRKLVEEKYDLRKLNRKLTDTYRKIIG